ncbi:MAG: hypothetical protein ACI8UO_001314 [Verrucomicrobiales bacterium]|jgi:uncharacterized protein YndB with AHSA1/START domain
MTSFEISETIEASAETIYSAWLDSDGHTKMTGGEATCSDQLGGEFTAWNGYISGKNLELKPGKLIKQEWRTTTFAEDDASSIIEISLEDEGGGCRVTLKHSEIPDGQSDYNQGWKDHYFSPMQEYFG